MARPSSRNEILRVFAELVAERGYADVSVADVAGALGLSKGTIVHHFGTKLNLLEHVHVSYMERRLREASYILASCSRPADQLAALIYALLKSHRDDRAATLAFLREFVRFASDAELGVRSQRAAYTELVEDVLARGMADGDFRTDDPRLVALQLFGMCNYAWTWYRPDGPNAVEDIAATFTRTLFNGLYTGAGRDDDEIDALVAEAIAVVNGAPPSGADAGHATGRV